MDKHPPSQLSDSRCTVLIVYDTNSGNAYRMAQLIGRGVESVKLCTASIRAVPKVGDRSAERLPAVPEDGAPYVQISDLAECDALIIGGPTHFGNMSASLKHFLDQTTEQWFKGTLTGEEGNTPLSETETALCKALGERVATNALKLRTHKP